ncbi:MAG: hypothetical protein JWN48_5349 [Myxococcaceae bacterium]|nr:hypothetical protein [Myxococcaceae bacterium]
MTRTTNLSLGCLLALLLAACSDDAHSPTLTPVADAALPPELAPPDASTPAQPSADGGTPAIPLLLWVDDLVDHHTSDDSAPDTVDDKNIVDDENPTAYDARFR